jgi:hypothetical protein
LPVSVHADGWWLSVLPIAQASVLRWVLMGGISTNQSFLAWPLWLCPGASTAACASFFGGVVLLGTCPGRGWWGLCLAHCWVLRQQDLFAAMQGGTSGVSFVPASGTSSAVDGLRFPLWGVGCGGCGLVDGVVV